MDCMLRARWVAALLLLGWPQPAAGEVGGAADGHLTEVEATPGDEALPADRFERASRLRGLADFEAAARAYEEFAATRSDDPRAAEALIQAMILRVALGTPDQALDLAERLVADHAAHRPDLAFDASIGVGRIHERAGAWKLAASHYERTLKMRASTLDRGQALRLRLELGHALRRQSVAERAGRARAELERRASSELEAALSEIDLARVPQESVKRRLDRYASILGLQNLDPGNDAARLVAFIDAVARARFDLAEEAHDRFLLEKVPPFRPKGGKALPAAVRAWWVARRGPEAAAEWDAMVRAMEPEARASTVASVQFQHWTETSFRPWLERSRKALDDAEERYVAVVDEDAPEWEIAAASGVGDLNRTMAASLDELPLDPAISSDAQLLAIYRQALRDAAAPFREKALHAYEHCHRRAVEYVWFSDAARSCASNLDRLAAGRYRPVDEIFAAPAYSSSPLARPAMIERRSDAP